MSFKYLRYDPMPFKGDSYISLGHNSTLVVDTNKKKLTLGKIKKDYYQNLEVLVHEGYEGLSTSYASGVNEVEVSSTETTADVVETKFNEENPIIAKVRVQYKEDGTFKEEVTLLDQFDWFICHPSWDTTEFDLIFTDASGENKHLHLECHEKTRSRYLYAFAIDTRTCQLSDDTVSESSTEISWK